MFWGPALSRVSHQGRVFQHLLPCRDRHWPGALGALPRPPVHQGTGSTGRALGRERQGGSPCVLRPQKVEMFGVTAAERGTESEELLDEFLGLQKEIFSELGLHYR